MSAECFQQTLIKSAKKHHKCIWCGEPIFIGQPYERQPVVFDGDFQDNKYHPECWSVAINEPFDEGFPAYGFKRGTTEER